MVPQRDLKIIVSNIGITPGFSSILTPNSAPHTAFVQVGLNEGHRLDSFAYMNLVRARLRRDSRPAGVTGNGCGGSGDGPGAGIRKGPP